eukprot:11889966-Alexandrium_andersonii.AAC.1
MSPGRFALPSAHTYTHPTLASAIARSRTHGRTSTRPHARAAATKQAHKHACVHEQGARETPRCLLLSC